MEMMELPTPETDALDCELHNPRVLQDRYSEMMEHARKLERERDEARKLAEAFHKDQVSLLRERDEARELLASEKITRNHIIKRSVEVERERDEARQRCADIVQKLDAWEEIAEYLHHLVQHPAYGVDQAIQRMDVLEAYKHLKNE